MGETLASRPGSTAQVRSARGWADPALSSVLSRPPEATLAARLLLVRAGEKALLARADQRPDPGDPQRVGHAGRRRTRPVRQESVLDTDRGARPVVGLHRQ